MSTPFSGTITVDIRDSQPDWAPFEATRAPAGSPSVVYVVLGDLGYGRWLCSRSAS